MKQKLNRIFFAAIFLAVLLSPLAAAPSFSGAVAGTAGLGFDIPLKGGSMDFKVPLAGLAAIQANVTDWCVARGEIAVDASNFEFDDIFSSGQSSVMLNELSVVLIRRAVTASSFFSAFLGEYEQLGSDTFFMRHFGIEATSSHLSKSPVHLAGVSILPTKGAGLSYIVNFDKAPIATGAYFYVGKNSSKEWALNLDTRFSLATNMATLDFLAGIGAPLQNSYKNSDVVLMIDTLSLRGGINVLLGNKFTHSLLMQFGINDIIVRGDGAGTLSGDDFNFILEPRINFKKFRMNVTAYAYNSDTVSKLLYLQDEFGAALSFLKDDIEMKNGFAAMGIHLIGSVGNKNFWDFFYTGETGGASYNAYISPYAEIPVSPTAQFDIMAQIGVTDISGDPEINLKFAVGGKKLF